MDKIKVLKFEKEAIDIQSYQSKYENGLKYENKDMTSITFRLIDTYLLFLCNYLHNRKEEARKYAFECKQWARKFFCPELEGKNAPIGERLSWMEQFRYSLVCCLYINDFQTAIDICVYPDDKCIVDTFYHEEHKFYYICLAMYIRNGKYEEFMHYYNLLTKSIMYKSTKLLSEVLIALYNKEESKFNEAFNIYIDFYRKRGIKKSDVTTYQSIDGTILYYLGCRENFKIPLTENAKLLLMI